MVQLPDDAPAPRLCLVEKESPDQEYGYNLHAEKGRGQFVGIVDKGSPADHGGLRTGDRIFAVNGHSIIGETHKKVVERIKEHRQRCEMLVIGEEGAKWYAERNIPITLQLPNIIKVTKGSSVVSSRRPSSAHGNGSPPPAAGWYAPAANSTKPTDPVFVAPPPPSADDRMHSHQPLICRLEKSSPSDEFGFNLHAEKGRGHFIGTVDNGSIGDRSGLKMGQRIVGVNGQLVYPTTPHKEVVALIKRSPLSTQLLVASEEVDKWYKDHNEEYSFEDAVEGRPEQRQQQFSPHSIQISDEEIHESPVTKRKESTPAAPVVHYDEPPVSQPEHNYSAQYDLPPLEAAAETAATNLLDAVFSVLPPAQEEPVIGSGVAVGGAVYYDEPPVVQAVEQPYLVEHGGHSRAPSEVGVLAPSVDMVEEHKHVTESAVDVPFYNAYSAEPVHFHSQVSPVSNGSSASSAQSHNGYSSNDSVSPAGDQWDIFGLSAKEARERLRHNKKRAMDMSLEEKYRLVSNM